MRAFSLIVVTLSACGHVVTHTSPGGRNSNPPLALQAPAAWEDDDIDGRDFGLYVPTAHERPLPLVVMLHDCAQTPASFAAATEMNALAESEGFFALYPAQSTSANADGCWNWYAPENQTRSGEPALIVAMVHEVARTHAIDASRIYIAGMSAGAALAVTTAVCYPEIFAAVAAHSGLEFRAARDAAGASWSMLFGGPDPVAQGAAAFACAARPGAGVPAIVFQGEADAVVAPVNATQVAAQLTAFNDWADDGVANASAAEAELHNVPGLAHEWSRDASAMIWDFFHSRAR